MDNGARDLANPLTRRAFLSGTATGLGAVALSTLLDPHVVSGEPAKDKWKGVVNPLYHPAKAKRVIWLTMAGGASHLETFDWKPKLAEMHGKPMPESMTKGQQLAQLQGQKLICYGPQTKFKKMGPVGKKICELFPHIAEVAGEIRFIHSMTTDAINHDPAHMFMNTGSQIAGRPSMGAWTLYGLGSETDDLPGFVVLTSLGAGARTNPSPRGNGRLAVSPAASKASNCAAEAIRSYTSATPPASPGPNRRTWSRPLIRSTRYDALVGDPEIATRIAQYEMAFRMQVSVPELMDTSKEPQQVLELYGCKPGDGSFASNCLLARRLAERGVRFIQLYHKDWDHHSGVKEGVEFKAQEVDRACAALIRDLKQSDMLKDTLIVWAGEFGRTPMSQGGDGRDHHNKGFTVWVAGGGIKGGLSYGATDELGYTAVEKVASVHDLHATMLHLLGIDPTRLSVKFQGLDARLIGVEPCQVLKGILV